MKRTIGFLISAFLITLPLFSQEEQAREQVAEEQTEQYVQYHGNGVKMIAGQYLFGARHGKWTEWYDNGVIKTEQEYQHGRKVGQWTEYFDNGKKKVQERYSGGNWIKP